MSFNRRKFLTAGIQSIATSQLFDRRASAQLRSMSASAAPLNAQTLRAVPRDLSDIRGFNYCPASALGNGSNGHEPHYLSMWLKYNPAETEFNLDLAKRLNLNQTRAMMSHAAWSANKQAYRQKLKHFTRACHDRAIGVMISNTYNEDPGWIKGTREGAREFVADLVDTLANEPGLVMWDASNEPDLKKDRPGAVISSMGGAKFLADTFHELDYVTPVTVGHGEEVGMEKFGSDSVDILQFHDYFPTRGEIRANIERAKKFSEAAGKPVIDGECGCLARANPYDVTLEEHMRAGVGWYIWELMIVPKGWGSVHGVFYENGTVRDPSIAAALMGLFRNRSQDICLELPDREGRVTETLARAKEWEAGSEDWDAGLRIAEMLANLLEAGQIVAMRELPTREVYLLRAKAPDVQKLQATIAKFANTLKPYATGPRRASLGE